MKYKKGDVVRILPELNSSNSTLTCTVINEMLRYAGKKTVITQVFDDDTYYCDADNGEYYWPENALRSSEITNADKIRSMLDEELAEFLVNFKNTFGEEHEGVMSCLEWLREAEE